MNAYFLLILSSAFLAWSPCAAEPSASQNVSAKPAVTFKPQEMADALHAVVAADREVYAKLYDTARQSGVTNLPIPAHLLRQASEAIQTKGAEFHYVLRSLSPINPKNAPETATEKAGLQFVIEHPESTYYAEESLGGRRYFTAVYADKAVVPSCVHCHNSQLGNTRKDFKIGEVMGGLVIRVPLEF